MVQFELLWAFFKIGLFSFGGGYAMVPLIEREVVYAHQWLSMSQFIDLIAISEMTPGPIAINSATFVGYRVGGVLGSILATLGVVLPSYVVVTVLAGLFLRYRHVETVEHVLRGIRPVVISLVIVAALVVLPASIVDWRTALIAVGGLLALRLTHVNPLLVLLAGGVVGVLLFH